MSRVIKKVTSGFVYMTRFLVPYLHGQDSIEQIFSVVKSELRVNNPEGNINFDKLNGAEFVMKILKSIDVHTCEKTWLLVLKK